MLRALLLCLGLASALPAQEQTLRGYLRDPSGAAVPDADVQFLPDPVPELPALDGLLPLPAARSLRSDAHGRFEIAGLGGAGSLLATTSKGLGAFAARCRPGEPLLLQLQPMAEVGAPGRSEALTLWAAAIGSAGGRRFLPPLQGAALRLPAGSYEVWYRLGDSLHWTRIELRPGARQDLPFAPARLQLQRRAEVSVQPLDWPQVEMFPGGSASCSLCGDAALAMWVTRVPGSGAVIGPCQLPRASATAPQPWPPPDLLATATMRLRLVGDDGRPCADAAAWLLRQQDAPGRWLPLGSARADGDGQLTLPRPAASAGCWLLLSAKGCAPTGIEVAALPSPAVLTLQPARALEVKCDADTDDGDVCLEFVPRDAGVAWQRSHTNSVGRARFAIAASGTGQLRVSDARFANAEIAVDATDTDVRLTLQPGAALQGRAVLAGDVAAAGALVTLRDPRGVLRPAVRTVIAGADGSFEFRGLDDQDGFVLFAHQRRDGRTWSGQLVAARADGSRYVLELRCEDPELPHGGDR